MAVKKIISNKKKVPVENAQDLGIEVTVINRDYSIKGGRRGDTISAYKDEFRPVHEISDGVAWGLMRTRMYRAYVIDGLWEGRDSWDNIEAKLKTTFDSYERKAILDANLRGVAIEVIVFDMERLHCIDKALQFRGDVLNIPEAAQKKIYKIIDKNLK
jgi:hypothetical protein